MILTARTSFLALGLASVLAACGEPPMLEGVVTDAWGKPIEAATVQLEGVVKQTTTDAKGIFHFIRPEGTLRLMAGKDGFIKNTASVTIPTSDDEAQPRPEIALYPEPERPGFYAVDRKPPLRHLEARRIKTVGTELRARTGLPDIGQDTIKSADGLRFVFSSTLRSSDLSRLDLQLHKLEFVGHENVAGVLGEEDVKVNLWVATDTEKFDIKGLPSRNDYLITIRGTLPPGAYAFHTEGLLVSTEVDALEKTPQEMQVAYPFEIN